MIRPTEDAILVTGGIISFKKIHKLRNARRNREYFESLRVATYQFFFFYLA